jgi:hypothetical protein
MSVPFRTRNALLLAGLQSAQGAEATLTPASNAVRFVDQLGYSPNFAALDTDYAESSISRTQPVIGGGLVQMKVPVILTPSTVFGATADPDYGVLMQGCSLSETKQAGFAYSAKTVGSATANSVTWTSSSGADGKFDGYYTGMIIQVSAGTGAGQLRVVTGYSLSAVTMTVFPNWTTIPDATSTVLVRKGTVYQPITTGAQYLTLWGYQHTSAAGGNSNRRRRIMDAMGSAQLTLKAREQAKLDFTFSGILPAFPDDVAKPTGSVYLGMDGPALMGASAFLGNGAAPSVKFSDFSLDFGNTVAAFDDPTQPYGYDSADVTLRDVVGTITPSLVQISQRATMTDWLSMNYQSLWIAWSLGTTLTPGSGLSIYIPKVRWTDVQPDDSGGFQVEKLKFSTGGNDSEFYISMF